MALLVLDGRMHMSIVHEAQCQPADAHSDMCSIASYSQQIGFTPNTVCRHSRLALLLRDIIASPICRFLF